MQAVVKAMDAMTLFMSDFDESVLDDFMVAGESKVNLIPYRCTYNIHLVQAYLWQYQLATGKKNTKQTDNSLFLVIFQRGWTTWIVGAIDERVSCMAPVVLSCLNMREVSTSQDSLLIYSGGHSLTCLTVPLTVD